MKWTRKNNEEQMTYQTAEKNNISCAYQIRKTKKIYEIFQNNTNIMQNRAKRYKIVQDRPNSATKIQLFVNITK